MVVWFLYKAFDSVLIPFDVCLFYKRFQYGFWVIRFY